MSQNQRGINDFYPKEPYSPHRNDFSRNLYGSQIRDSFQNAGMNMLSPTRKEENKQNGALNLSKAA